MVSLPDHLQAKPAGQHRLAPEVRAEHQRERILDAAIEVFAAHGYQGTTIDDIVAAAKVGVGSFYDLFDNKPACFVEAYERIVVDARRRIADAAPDEAEWPEQACAVLRALLELIEAEPVRARVALVEGEFEGAEAYLPDVLEIAVVPYVGREKAADLLAASKRDDSSAAAA